MDDIARFEWFCKLRSQIRDSDNHLIVGIDIAKDKLLRNDWWFRWFGSCRIHPEHSQ
jgi:hypothetical protein